MLNPIATAKAPTPNRTLAVGLSILHIFSQESTEQPPVNHYWTDKEIEAG